MHEDIYTYIYMVAPPPGAHLLLIYSTGAVYSELFAQPENRQESNIQSNFAAQGQ